MILFQIVPTFLRFIKRSRKANLIRDRYRNSVTVTTNHFVTKDNNSNSLLSYERPLLQIGTVLLLSLRFQQSREPFFFKSDKLRSLRGNVGYLCAQVAWVRWSVFGMSQIFPEFRDLPGSKCFLRDSKFYVAHNFYVD